ncbi:MAG: hypothetical protein H6907_13435 [Hyphomicrobiales bacterium]|nr:hypothetical protein [Hyphomicrobiales bacterium]MCP5372727.1 hypothetical protein [Hyphomicrobiales bacterium]
MTPAVKSAFDVAFWFSDTALNHNEYLQPQKLHRLLFLAQAYYAVAYRGQMLMPAVFVADEMGPIEPNLYVAFSRGRPDVEVDIFLTESVEAFLDGIWRRFGHRGADSLTRLAKESDAYRQAFAKGNRSHIPLASMQVSFTRAERTPSVNQVMRPKVLRSQTGRPVSVSAWSPPTRDPAPHTILRYQEDE